MTITEIEGLGVTFDDCLDLKTNYNTIFKTSHIRYTSLVNLRDTNTPILVYKQTVLP